MKVSSLHVYPVKGARGIRVDAALVHPGGFAHDRRFVVVNAKGFITQRTHPKLALVQVAFADGDRFELSAEGFGAVHLPLVPTDGARAPVAIFDMQTEGVVVAGDGGEFFTRFLGEPCRVLFMTDNIVRPLHASLGDGRVGYADTSPILLASLASLADLNARLAEPVKMSRFRPNIVVDGAIPYAEDGHASATIGAMRFRMPQACERCSVILVDQETGAVGKEPLRTLATYRKDNHGVTFAQHLVPVDDEGVVAVGDPVAYA